MNKNRFVGMVLMALAIGMMLGTVMFPALGYVIIFGAFILVIIGIYYLHFYAGEEGK